MQALNSVLTHYMTGSVLWLNFIAYVMLGLITQLTTNTSFYTLRRNNSCG